MSDVKTQRPYQERLLDGYERSQLRQEVQKVKPARFRGLKKKYATYALGASLALGGLGAPLKMIQNASDGTARNLEGSASAEGTPSSSTDDTLKSDLQAARSIADQVAGGVKAAASGVASVASDPLAPVTAVPRKLAAVTQSTKEHFFKTEVPFGSIIYSEAKKNDLPPELVAAVVQAESKFKPTAQSHAGAIGLMQLVPKTGRWMGAKDLRNPAQNIQAGAKYLRYLHDRFDGDQQKVIAAYNAGEGNVRRFNGVPPFRETRNYVAKVSSFQRDFSDRAETHGSSTLVADADAR